MHKMAGDIIYKVSSAVLTVFLLVASTASQEGVSTNQRNCSYRGTTILHGDHLRVDACTTCSCDDTTVRCDIESCQVVSCGNEEPITDPSKCCPRCPFTEEQDVKLTGGGHNFQGYVQVYNASMWRLICPDTWTRDASDLVCKKLGLLGKAMTGDSDKAYEKDDNPRNVIGVGCNSTDTQWEDCTFYGKECAPDNAVKVECALPNYVGCFPDSEDSRALVGKVATDLDGVTIAGCSSACREEGFAYAGLVAPSTCLCGSAGENLDKKEKLSDETCVQGCSGAALQACGKEGEAAAVYDVSVGNCGGRIKAKEGIVASPGFPENYSIDNPKICQWVIDLSENGDTLIDFTMFDLDPRSEDKVGYAEDDGEWTDYIYNQRPDKIMTSAKQLRLRFIIAARNGGGMTGESQGFLASFSDATRCDDQEIVNGTLKMVDEMEYGPGDKVKLLCDDGYLPNYSQLVCTSTGRWYPVPKCEPGRSMMPSLAFTTTLLYMMVTFVGVLGVIILSIIVAMMCIRSKKKSEGYKGISSGESGYQKGPDDLDEKDTKLDMQDQDGMHDDGMDMMHSNEQAIPLATAGAE
ncbi:uncharacterized protein [Amphiura filiformis]|uniref:uncharacterized protein isoform X2 n=1 Tax=Amphiura filiformis TaxID=82378 RepID=UPI003B227997